MDPQRQHTPVRRQPDPSAPPSSNGCYYDEPDNGGNGHAAMGQPLLAGRRSTDDDPDMCQFGGPCCNEDPDDPDSVRLREGHSTFRTGAGQRLHRMSSQRGPRRPRRKWETAGAGGGGSGAGGGEDAEQEMLQHQYNQQQPLQAMTDVTGAARGPAPADARVVRMKRSEAWGKFLAYEGCCQVCMHNFAASAEARYFLESGCTLLRSGLGLDSLLLQPLTGMQINSAISSGEALEVGTEIIWDDVDNGDRRLGAAAFMNAMSVLRVRVVRVSLSGKSSVWSKLTCKKNGYETIAVRLKLRGEQQELRFAVGTNGQVLPGGPSLELQAEQLQQELQVEVTDNQGSVARGSVNAKRVWHMGADNAPWTDGSDSDGSAGSPHAGCSWFNADDPTAVAVARGNNSGMWVNVFNEDQNRSGQVLLSLQRVQRELLPQEGPGARPEDLAADSRGQLRVNSCQAYDFLLDAALRAQCCGEMKLEVTGEWTWLLNQFAGQYAVRTNYALMSHLRWVLRPGVASVRKHCFDLIGAKMRALLQAESMGGLTPHEATMLSRIKQDVEELLKLAFENYYCLNRDAPKGIMDGVGMVDEFPPEALYAAFDLFRGMRDVFSPNDQEWLNDRFRLAAKKRWHRLAVMCDDLHTLQGAADAHATPTTPLNAPLNHARRAMAGKPAATAAAAGKVNQIYKRMDAVCNAVRNELEYDMRLQSCANLLPSTVNLPQITATEYCVNFVAKLRAVLHQHPPNTPTEPTIDLLVAVARLQRYLEQRCLALPKGHPGCIDAMDLFGHYVRSWITNSQEMLCSTCRQLEATTELGAASNSVCPPGSSGRGSAEEGGVAPIVQEMLRHVVNEMHRYEKVIQHWPVFGPYLEAALCVVLRAIIGAVSRQCGMTRVLLMVREAVLLNSMKRLMVAVPNYEGQIRSWSGGAAMPPPGPPHPQAPTQPGYEDVAPNVGAQFAMVVKELRTEYAAAVASTAERMSNTLCSHPSSSLKVLLSQPKLSAAGPTNPSPMQQNAAMEAALRPLMGVLQDALGALKGALDSRVFVAMGRGLWDFVGRELYEFVECLQEGQESKGAWRARQNASIVLALLNQFFKGALLSHMEHGLQDRDLSVPMHVDKALKLLDHSTTTLNMSFTPF